MTGEPGSFIGSGSLFFPFNMTPENQLDIEVGLIHGWLKDTTEPFDDWDWNGRELTLFLDNDPIEKYTRETLAEAIPGFPTTTTTAGCD